MQKTITKQKENAIIIHHNKISLTHHGLINCCNMGATSWGHTQPRRPMVIAIIFTGLPRRKKKKLKSQRRHQKIANT